jgi:hypothetical protein
MSEGDTGIERTADQLIVRTQDKYGCFGGIFVVIGIAELWLLLKISPDPPMALFIVLHAAVFMIAGILASWPRSVTTIFDLGLKEVRRTAINWRNLANSSRRIPFAEITSIGFDQPDSTEPNYTPLIRLRTGEAIRITSHLSSLEMERCHHYHRRCSARASLHKVRGGCHRPHRSRLYGGIHRHGARDTRPNGGSAIGRANDRWPEAFSST